MASPRPPRRFDQGLLQKITDATLRLNDERKALVRRARTAHELLMLEGPGLVLAAAHAELDARKDDQLLFVEAPSMARIAAHATGEGGRHPAQLLAELEMPERSFDRLIATAPPQMPAQLEAMARRLRAAGLNFNPYPMVGLMLERPEGLRARERTAWAALFRQPAFGKTSSTSATDEAAR